jgi:ATP-binding cassette subfamily B protein
MKLARAVWSGSQLADAMHALAERAGLDPETAAASPAVDITAAEAERVDRYVEALATGYGIEAEPVSASYAEVGDMVVRAGPALIRLPGTGEFRFIALLSARRGRVALLAPGGEILRAPAGRVRDLLCAPWEADATPEIDRLLTEAGVSRWRRVQARAAVMRERLAERQLPGAWILRLAPSAPFRHHVRAAGLIPHFIGLAASHAAQYGLLLVAWWMIGQAALEGRLEQGWLIAWGLVLLSIVPFRLWELWLQGRIAIGGGALLKLRLLHGALRLDPEAIKKEGAGSLLGKVIEAQAVEGLALGAGFLTLMAAIEVILTLFVLALGSGGAWHTVIFGVWVVFTLVVCRRYFRERRGWTDARVDMTHDLVERMVGHRTRLAQESPERWHDGEDDALERYLARSAALDRIGARLQALISRGWLLLGLGGLVPAFAAGDLTTGGIAVALGGILLGARALASLSGGLVSLAGAVIAWREISPLFHAASRVEPAGAAAFAAQLIGGGGTDGHPVVEAHELVFRYRDRGTHILRGCNLRVGRRDRLLLQGPSGGGKSTLASLLTGLRTPESGLLLLHGLDPRTLGADGWRRRVVSAPQFHENHVLTETFAFNLLMGRGWPPRAEDFHAAEALCRELGLADLLARMPSGLLQMVGESGWQLSHGERSRLFIARALLQQADLVVLDESFAALDPETLRRALRCVLERAPALLVIAHP